MSACGERSLLGLVAVMSEENEKRPLLSTEQTKETQINEGNYGAAADGAVGPQSAPGWWERNREKVPGYGMLRLARRSGLYSLFVLAVLLVAYLLNQLDRYTLPVVTSSMGPDIGYGDKTCQVNPHVNSSLRHQANFNASLCTSSDFQ